MNNEGIMDTTPRISTSSTTTTTSASLTPAVSDETVSSSTIRRPTQQQQQQFRRSQHHWIPPLIYEIVSNRTHDQGSIDHRRQPESNNNSSSSSSRTIDTRPATWFYRDNSIISAPPPFVRQELMNELRRYHHQRCEDNLMAMEESGGGGGTVYGADSSTTTTAAVLGILPNVHNWARDERPLLLATTARESIPPPFYRHHHHQNQPQQQQQQQPQYHQQLPQPTLALHNHTKLTCVDDEGVKALGTSSHTSNQYNNMTTTSNPVTIATSTELLNYGYLPYDDLDHPPLHHHLQQQQTPPQVSRPSRETFLSSKFQSRPTIPISPQEILWEDEDEPTNNNNNSNNSRSHTQSRQTRTICDRITHAFTMFMFHGIQWDEQGMPYFPDDLDQQQQQQQPQHQNDASHHHHHHHDNNNHQRQDETFSSSSSTSCCDGCGWTAAMSPSAWFRFLIYNPIYPEFSSVQQSCWAVMIGISMGVFTALWRVLIDHCVTFMYQTIPSVLLHYKIFTDLDGRLPLPYYFIFCQALCGGVLSYLNTILPTKVPGQNEWIEDTHYKGVIDASSFGHLFLMSTAAMASGLSLGPELPLVLLGGMYGSSIARLTKQSLLQARVQNLTAASATVSAFFGFPMAGALFVLELPHRMGLQYFEALTPTTMSSIVAVITNRLVSGNDVTGYYRYPYLENSLPSRIFVSAIAYGAFGCLIGLFYAKSILSLKHVFAGLFRNNPTISKATLSSEIDHSLSVGNADTKGLPLMGSDDDDGDDDNNHHDQSHPSIQRNDRQHRQMNKKKMNTNHSMGSYIIPHEPSRAAVVGLICGGIVGITCMYLPHLTFWGERQLQILIDQGRTTLPIFGTGDDPTAIMTAYGYCMLDRNDPQILETGYGMKCSALLAIGKIWTTGISLGTGIVAGHFWGPLFVGCAAAQFFMAFFQWMQQNYNFGASLVAHPCVVILCIMGSSHVVTYRSHLGITLILTLTIASFGDDDDDAVNHVAAGDYSAIFPLLVVAVYVSFILARNYTFYSALSARGDILALPEVLCEPGKIGRPLAMQHKDDFHDDDSPRERGFECVRLSSTTRSKGGDTDDGSIKSTGSKGSKKFSHEDNNSESGNSGKSESSATGGADGKGLVRVVAYGAVTNYQPSILTQARARAATKQDGVVPRKPVKVSTSYYL